MDWKQIISELQARGYTQPQIARYCGCGQASISDLATGKTSQPRYSLGELLLQLHRKRRTPAKAEA